MAEPQTGSSLRFQHPEDPNAVTPLSDAEFVRIANRGKPSGATVTDDTPEAAKRNRDKALEELSLISELRGTRSFAWFYDVCLRRNYKAARDLVDSTTEDDGSQLVRLRVAAFQQWRKAVRWLIEREIEARRLLDPKDPLLGELRKDLEGI